MNELGLTVTAGASLRPDGASLRPDGARMAETVARWLRGLICRRSVATLPDYLLKDIGLTRADLVMLDDRRRTAAGWHRHNW